MGVSVTLENFLKTRDVNFDILEHQYTEGSINTASTANIPPGQLIKGVVFRDEDLHYTMAVVPASNRVLRHTLNEIMGRRLELAAEDELDDIFFDCEHGAIPSFGQAYGMNIIWDDELDGAEDVWIEAGDHEHLIHIKSGDFKRLMNAFMHDKISCERRRKSVYREEIRALQMTLDALDALEYEPQEDEGLDLH